MKSFLSTALLFCLSACVTEKEPAEVLLSPGDAMPQFEVTALDGTSYSPQTLRGRESVIVFFNTECEDCQRELPEIQLQADAEPEVQYLCIAREEGAETIAAYWAEHGLTMPVAPQADREVYSKFARIGIPRSFYFTSALTLIYFH